MSGSEQSVALQLSGCYRVVESFDQGWRFSFAEGGRRGPAARAVIEADAPDIDLDLGGHALSSNTGISGVSSPHVSGAVTHRLVIRNGAIDLSQSDGDRTGPAVTAPQFQVRSVHALRNYKPVPHDFDHVEYVLENLHIKVGGIGALLMGDGIVIRHCTIDVDGENAIVIYGPNAVIEDNRITYRYNNANPTLITATYPATPGHYPQIPAAIYLRSADDAVVRDNTIVVEGRVPAAGIAIIDSLRTHVERNGFDGTIEPYVLTGTSADLSFKQNWYVGGFFNSDKPIADVVASEGGIRTQDVPPP